MAYLQKKKIDRYVKPYRKFTFSFLDIKRLKVVKTPKIFAIDVKESIQLKVLYPVHNFSQI